MERGKNSEVLDGPQIRMHRRNNMIKMLSSAKDTFILIYTLFNLSIIECTEMYFSSNFFETPSVSAVRRKISGGILTQRDPIFRSKEYSQLSDKSYKGIK